ncbi:phosphoenolpyruvate synthase [candidate division WWE3 bacterium CG_4_9_14_0_2_um_filter_35_11]|uniref:Phosphoenolpyruvate synthase n=1 Tax=candidate division WWE3 bacterium CG_4_9_14_0_2_um_filter_35_11 TaxID=1975077 RepID=A0A2M8EL83_UNCKA|nr:MAG: phosphoenolpyruvate synthase [candidate division WWE3 bacterium CG10_big_fil_rev_8_21_14_0_10_35_32]PJC23504.1 MAG: phosphoenolpyruvate synthase [candidate division WWE3 bacterium CG_4_9_14_0_2_um_filter_35_11]
MPNPTAGKVFTLPFSQISKNDIAMAGGKGANLGEMYNAKIPVPNGFVVTSKAYYHFIETSGLKEKILLELKNLDVENSKKLQTASDNIIKLILKEQIAQEVQDEIKNMYHGLSGTTDKQVAVRSSATAEDLPEASFAGQQETYLNISGWREVVKSTKMCWASLFGARAIYYRARQGFDHFKVGIAVPIQLMIQSEISGIMFTINPLTNNKDQISIEAAYGLGQPVVSGELTPDQYFVSKNGYKIEEKFIIPQTWQLTQKGRITISKHYQKKQKLDDKYIIKLAHIGMQLENHYGRPQDIEWGLYNKKLYIVQTRPVTTIGKKKETVKVDVTSKVPAKDVVLEGSAASPGYASGKVKIIHDVKDIDKIKQGHILVTEMTNPDFVPAMRKASAIVTDEGGVTSHAAIVSRELGIPAVVGTKHATSMLKDGEIITVNGYNGQIYTGDYAESLRKIKPEEDYSEYKNAKTATKVYVNLGEPELAQKIGQMGVDGIGLLRAEFMIAGIGKHPRKFIQEKKQKVFIDKLVESLKIFVESFEGRPVIYRATDFKTNEYRSLKGGAEFEDEENNPMIGFRGVSRYLVDDEVFKMEVEAIKIIRNKLGYKNLHLMLPFVRTTKELIDVKKLLTTFGLTRKGSFELYLMVEIPSAVILLDDFIDVGIDGISIGSNDLTMLILGVDRDNEKVAGIYDERNPAVLWALEKAITTAKRRNIKASICGQAPSRFPELTRSLVKWGVTSVSVSPDVAYLTRKIISESEYEIARKS